MGILDHEQMALGGGAAARQTSTGYLIDLRGCLRV
jgi:hypothetical protein